MDTSFLFVFTLLLSIAASSNTTLITTSSNVTCIERERQSLLAFKQSLIDRYNLLSTWRGVECCEWKGVGCDSRNGHVVKLDLRSPTPYIFYISDESKVLGGKLSPCLQNLKHLHYLDLSVNNFSGNIPQFIGSFKHLKYLNLSNSGLGGVVPRHLGNLSRLQYLDLRNYFVFKDYPRVSMLIFQDFKAPMAIPDDLGWVSHLSSLRHLDLSGITIGKHIDWFPTVNMLPSLVTLNLAFTKINLSLIKLVNFTSLNSLDLSSNNISSTIPMWLSNLTSLMHLDLEDNYFHGKIPDFLGMSSALVSIDLSVNSFDTSMPDQLFNLSSLVHLRLSYNKFSGPIPTSLGQLLRLEDLRLRGNQLSGNIPMSLGQLSKLKYLDLSYNSLVGLLSKTHLAKLTNLYELDLSGNSLQLKFNSQWAPPFQLQSCCASSYNVGPRFPKWLQTQTNLQILVLSNSSIRDTIPEWFQNIVPRIDYLDLSNNQIGGKLPRFHVDGSNEIKDINLVLNMSSNKFEGMIPILPTNVHLLDLSDNLLSGHLPKIDGTMNPEVEVLDLSRNLFTGSIPAQLCKFHSINVLDFSQNKFSGRLPRCLGNLINLVAMDLSNNTITGVVPSSLGSLNSLIWLHLQNNRFEGNIPTTLTNLTKLVTLDLGKNLLMGNIPSWIGEKLFTLRFLNLESNKFTGKIPLQLCQLSVQFLNLAHNNITGMIPRCLGNIRGMISTIIKDDYHIKDFEDKILASMKGRQVLYNKNKRFLVSLDLSNNNIVGEIPDSLMKLLGLKSLNLSGNHLQGHIPMAIGDLKQLESLDLSINKLPDWISQSLTNLNFLSSLNLSFNDLSGPIPVGNQLQTLDDPSIYEGNKGLCGPPLSRSCNGNDVSYDLASEDEGKDDTDGLWFYAGMGPGFAVRFLGLLGSLHLFMSWRVAYFEMLENVYGWLMVSILLNRARLRRNFSNKVRSQPGIHI